MTITEQNRLILRRMAYTVLKRLRDPGADMKTLAEQMRQTADLVEAEQKAIRVTTVQIPPEVRRRVAAALEGRS